MRCVQWNNFLNLKYNFRYCYEIKNVSQSHRVQCIWHRKIVANCYKSRERYKMLNLYWPTNIFIWENDWKCLASFETYFSEYFITSYSIATCEVPFRMCMLCCDFEDNEIFQGCETQVKPTLYMIMQYCINN